MDDEIMYRTYSMIEWDLEFEKRYPRPNKDIIELYNLGYTKMEISKLCNVTLAFVNRKINNEY